MTQLERSFSGAKIILHCDGALITYLRDDKPNIPFRALWDLPGGGAEGDETPQDCALRETFEEFGLRIDPERISWGRQYPSVLQIGSTNWFFAAPVTPTEIARIQFGDEGQYWQLMAMTDYVAHKQAVPHLQLQVQDFLAEEIRHIART
ncbi:MAG: NUDIX hydrolase [Planktotalea sp.]|uniref:NUDIX hydrolase n=1 Tax=Planktotalea sp. TaxID=2029877 RepID=UPI003C78608E